jgi:uncharacterized protein YbjT (DUF2867 family)
MLMKVFGLFALNIASVSCFTPSALNVHINANGNINGNGNASGNGNINVRSRSGFGSGSALDMNMHTSTNTNSQEEGQASTSTSTSAAATRRDFFTKSSSVIAVATASLLVNPEESVAADYSNAKVLVLGGSGFVGTQVCSQLDKLGIQYVATSRNGRDNTKALDFTDSSINVSTQVEAIAKDFGCTAVISCIGAIGTSDDELVNSGTGLAAIGAKAAGVNTFVYISVAPEVRDSAKGISFLQQYMTGKQFSENTIKSNFESYTLIEPTFIYGGDKFAINPPRVADGYGKLVEGLLSSGPFRAAASISPGIIGVALEPPVKVGAVAGAAVSGALGLSQLATLDTYDKINDASKLI